MPNIGRPNLQNNFKNIRMAQKDPKKQLNARSKDEVLNELAGSENRKSGIQYADRKKHNTLGKNDFMKLLSHQLSNQDPMNPMDQKKFASELAQFSSLEQLANINTKLKSMDQNAPSEGKFYGASFLGKQVMTRGTSLKFDGSKEVDAPFTLDKRAVKLIVRVLDRRGQMVAQIDRNNYASGPQSVTWNGKMQDGTVAAAGDYAFEVFAWDKNFSPFKGKTKTSGIVTAVNFKNGETVFEVDGKKKVFLRDVESFKLLEHNKELDHGMVNNQQAANTPTKTAVNSYENINQMGQ